MFWRKQKEVETAIGEYLSSVETCLAAFLEMFDAYFGEGLGDRFEQLVRRTHALESDADDRRRKIEEAMYGGALLPESRGDVLGMLESIDLVPNKLESVAFMIWLESLRVPEEFAERMRRIVMVNGESLHHLCTAARRLFQDRSQVGGAVEEVCRCESESDDLERTLLKALFDSDLERTDVILLKELVIEIGSISDRAENAGDRLRIIAVKRQE